MKIVNDIYSTPIRPNFKASLLAKMAETVAVQQVPQQPAVAQPAPVQTQLTTNTAFVPVSTPIADTYKKSLLSLLPTNNTNIPAPIASTSVAQTTPVAPVGKLDLTPPAGYKNNLRSMFQNNQAVIFALVPRTFNAKDTDGNELIEGKEEPGYFTNMVERLDELKTYGINTLHWLPINPPGHYAAKGNAGSVYAPLDYLSIDPNLDDPRYTNTVNEEAKYAVNECHKRGIRVMVDLPSCMSLDLYDARPDLSATDREGRPKTPEGWEDIRMFNPWQDEDKGTLNPALMDYHKRFIDMCLDLGIDGIRADVGRAKPPQFWDELICYARQKDPEFAFLAECYTYEDASPMKNMPADRPEDVLDAGFDSWYGQYHIFDIWKAKDFHKFIKESIDITNKTDSKGNHLYDKGKSMIGSFATHDDVSPMSHGGPDYCMMTNVVQTTLPMTNPYIISGYESGDRYIYSYGNQPVNQTFAELIKNPSYEETMNKVKNDAKAALRGKDAQSYEGLNKTVKEWEQLINSSDKNKKVAELLQMDKYKNVMNYFKEYVLTKDNIINCVHNEKLDIFNKSRKPGGKNPEIGFHFGYLMNCVRPKYGELITKGSYIPLQVKNNGRDEVIAYARYKDGKALITVVNHDVNSKQNVKVVIPGLKHGQDLSDIAPKYGKGSTWNSEEGLLNIDLGPAQAHIFELENFDINKADKILTQYL